MASPSAPEAPTGHPVSPSADPGRPASARPLPDAGAVASPAPQPASAPASAQAPVPATLGEFELIERIFATRARASAARHPGGAANPLRLGIGDDCALLQPTPGRQWAVSSDMLVEGRHFLSTVPPERLGHKALAVNLSDLAACGADPLGFTLALALPRADGPWLQALAEGLFALADAHGIQLVGGDTTAGPLNLCITVFGELPPGQALRRDGARPGDQLWVSHPPGGGIGDARLALEAFRGRVRLDADGFDAARRAMELPQPRVALGRGLRGLASAAIDLSDGLCGDLGHVLARSGVGACLQADALPCSPVLAAQPQALRRLCTLAGGDDYELLFSAPAACADAVRAAAAAAGVAVSPVGRIEAEPGLRVVDAAGQPLDGRHWRGFDHFSA